MKHILFISRGMAYGGSGRCISVFSGQLAKAGYQVSLLVLRDYATEYAIAPDINVIRTHFMTDKVKVGKIDVLCRWFPEIIKSMKRLSPDLVIPFGVDICLLAMIGNFYNKRICVTVRSDPAREPANRIFRMLRDFIYRRAPYIWVQNDQQKEWFRNFAQDQFVTVPNPIREEICKQSVVYSGKMHRFITLGRLSKQKNQALLINAFGKISKKHKYVTLDIYGEGELRKELEEQIKRIGCEKSIFLRGRTENVIEALEAADAFILSSNHEGMPNALMEAMALGLPCISTDCNTGPRDLVTDKENGRLVPCNDVERLYEAIESFILYPDVAVQYGKRARQDICQRYQEQRICSRFRAEVEKMCAGEEG